MANVASIAANNDREIGNLLADAMEKSARNLAHRRAKVNGKGWS